MYSRILIYAFSTLLELNNVEKDAQCPFQRLKAEAQ